MISYIEIIENICVFLQFPSQGTNRNNEMASTLTDVKFLYMQSVTTGIETYEIIYRKNSGKEFSQPDQRAAMTFFRLKSS